MLKTHFSHSFNIFTQVMPYLMITATLVSISYIYANVFDQNNHEVYFTIRSLL